MKWQRIITMLLLTMLCAMHASEPITHPVYESWSDSKAGTVITFSNTAVKEGKVPKTYGSSFRLVSIDEQKCVIETTFERPGQESLVQKAEVQRLVTDVNEIAKIQAAQRAGKEVIQTPLGEFECIKVQEIVKENGREYNHISWFTVKVPGYLAKQVTIVDGVTVTMEIESIKTP